MVSWYAEKMMELPIYEESYKMFRELLHCSDAKILDIGCGLGVISAYLQQQCPIYQLSGIDFSAEMISLAQSHLPQGHFQVTDCRQMNFETASFDGVVCGDCIPYLDSVELENFFKDIAVMLKEGGILYVSFLEGDEEASGFTKGSTGDWAYFFYHDLNWINQLTKSIGLNKSGH
ncbi:MAG TPA: class I SAM-dependent methyltransferase [Chitinophagaceae bacterium]|nr:class I SAM-dependent methyltransferase [Chitinophagaceae bacterium]